MATLTGWRVFAVDYAGRLHPPFVRRYWPRSGASAVPWEPGITVAHCTVNPEHVPPVESCTCGLRATEDLAELLAAVTGRGFALSQLSILAETGVLARVELSGKLAPGVPGDDPPTTWRGSQARLLDLHLAPGMAAAETPLRERYAVPVAVYDPQGWPRTVAPLPAPERPLTPSEAFCEAIRPLGMGRKRTDPPEPWLPVAENVVQMLRAGVTPSDAGRVLFDSNARPTWPQCKAFILAAIEHLAPELAYLPDGFELAQPVRIAEAMKRTAVDALTVRRSA